MNSKIIDVLRRDEVMKTLVDNHMPTNVVKKRNVYNHLIQSVVSQQLSVKAADTIHKRFLALFIDETVVPNDLLNFSHEKLRSVGLSNQKAKYIVNITNAFNDNNWYDLNWRQFTDDEILKMLTQIKGVGEWTVQMVLMFALSREDVLPLGDQVIYTQIKNRYELEGDKKDLIPIMKKIAESWRPYRSYACMYLWAAKDS